VSRAAAGRNPLTAVSLSRRQLLAFGWFPFFRPRHTSLAGARFRILRNGSLKRHYLLIHGDEETARQVLTRFMETHEGTAFLIETHTRNVRIDKGEIDPNRMFSRAGAEASLKMLNAEWTAQQMQAALAILDREGNGWYPRCCLRGRAFWSPYIIIRKNTP
jgi:hypothetical protein